MDDDSVTATGEGLYYYGKKYNNYHLQPSLTQGDTTIIPSSSSSNLNNPNCQTFNDEKSCCRRLIIVGTGWGSLGLLHGLLRRSRSSSISRKDRKDDPSSLPYDCITLISPNNYFQFTPLLTAVASGLVKASSILQSVYPLLRQINRIQNIQVEFIRGLASSINPSEQIITIHSNHKQYNLHYATLVVATGVKNTNRSQGTVPGVVEHTLPIRHVQDALEIKRKTIRYVEDLTTRAKLGWLSEDELNESLHWVVVGSGPSGIELLSSLYDWLSHEKTLLTEEFRSKLRFTLISHTNNVLGAFERQLQHIAEQLLVNAKIAVIKNVCVEKVEKNQLTLRDNTKIISSPNNRESNSTEVKQSPTSRSLHFGGLCFWAAGNILPTECKFIQENKHLLSENNGLLVVDPWLRLYSKAEISPTQFEGSIYAIGDIIDQVQYDAQVFLRFPRTGQVAYQQGIYLSGLLQDSLASKNSSSIADKFLFRNRGTITSFGDRVILFDVSAFDPLRKNHHWIGSHHFTHLTALLAYKSVYLYTLLRGHGWRIILATTMDTFSTTLYGRQNTDE